MTSVLTNSLWITADIELTFRDRVLAGIPKHGKPLDYFVSLKGMSDDEAKDFRARIKAGELTDEEKAEMKEVNWCCFESDHDDRLCVWHGNIKAMFREGFAVCQKIMKGTTEKGGRKFNQTDKKHHLQVGTRLTPLRPYFSRDGNSIAEPDAFMDKVKHVEDKFGNPMSALGRHDYLDRPTLAFQLSWLKVGPFEPGDIGNVLAVCETVGLGACRSQGYGTFDVTKFDVPI